MGTNYLAGLPELSVYERTQSYIIQINDRTQYRCRIDNNKDKLCQFFAQCVKPVIGSEKNKDVVVFDNICPCRNHLHLI